MFDFIKNIFSGNKSYVGVDIGTTSIKAVELSLKGQIPYLNNYAILESFGHFERANNVIQANAVKISEKETVAMLKILFKSGGFKTRSVIASVPQFSSYISLIELPDMSEEETQKTMVFQIKQNIPLPLSDIAIDWIRVGQRKDENGFVKQQVLLVAIPNETIARFKSIFKSAGLNLRALEVENLSYVRSVIGSDQTPTIIVDIGARSTGISVVEQGFLKGVTQVDYAGDSLTSAIVKGLGISYKRAEELKKQRGITGGVGEYELSTLEIPFIDVIINEVKKVKAKFEGEFGVNIQRVILIGGGANLVGIEEYFSGKFDVPVVLGNGLLYIEAPSRINVVGKEIQTRFAGAIGLAIKGFMQSN
ncbi:MAG: type IV pilus assembly protein PilM [Candidatus Paceibacterota bacterium]|jgi:type IV pilus assembly protein PilM